MKKMTTILSLVLISSSVFAGQFKAALPVNSTLTVKENIQFSGGWPIVTFRPSPVVKSSFLPINSFFYVKDGSPFCNLNDIGSSDKSSDRILQRERKFKVVRIEESDGETNLSNPSNPIKATYYLNELDKNAESEAPVSVTCYATLNCKKSVIRGEGKNFNYYYNSCYAEAFGKKEVQEILGKVLDVDFAQAPSL